MAQELALATIRKNQPKLEALATKVNTINKDIMANFRNAVVGAKEAGKWLLDMKDLLPHGHFESYVEDKTDLTGRTARRYMLLNERWDEIEDKLGPDAYVSTIDGCLRIVSPPTQNKGNRPSLASFPPTEAYPDGRLDDGEEEVDSGLSNDIAESARVIRERREAAERADASGDEANGRVRTPKDPIKACEEDIEDLFGKITRRLEDYNQLKPNRLHFDVNQGLDHCYGNFRSWKKQRRGE